MRPALSIPNQADHGWDDAVLGGSLAHAQGTPANRSNRFGVKASSMVVGALGTNHLMVMALCAAVAVVVADAAKPEVPRVATARSVACVADAKTVRDGAFVGELPCNPMRKVLDAVALDRSIPRLCSSLPKPAGIGRSPLYAGPETSKEMFIHETQCSTAALGVNA